MADAADERRVDNYIRRQSANNCRTTHFHWTNDKNEMSERHSDKARIQSIRLPKQKTFVSTKPNNSKNDSTVTSLMIQQSRTYRLQAELEHRLNDK